ncbi:MAG TPA: NAD(P)H-hydrate dehydratase [Flavobacteriaceae bacterium]|nr:NAD(P)H-hydrate dehydratase [Flavobacteriaceae bacterium]HIP27291.1 NAD(P)H-hydrate dehydratase [Flavobacteriaceae bacterium]
MEKILNSKQLQKTDNATIKAKKITSLDLMEFASNQCFEWIHNRLQGNPLPIHIICGTGNNGGDGLVVARMLKKHGYNIKTYVINCDNKRSSEFLTNYERLKELGDWPIMINCDSDFPEISENDMVIDAIFGIGLNRAPQGLLLEVIQHINKSKAYVLSIDMPSGLFSDKSVKEKESVVKAFQVLTFETPKLAFLLPENKEFCLNWDVIPIGLDIEYINKLDSDFFLIEKTDMLSIYKMRDKFSHKGSYGHSLIIGGSFGKIGAVSLSAKAALKIGSGLVTAYIPKCGYSILQSYLPEAMVEVDSEKELQFFNFKTKPTVIGIGIGMGTSKKTQDGFANFLKQNALPLVIDADGLNIISKNKDLLELLPQNTVLTPHPKELERLLGKWENDFDKLKKIQKFTKKHPIILIVKGANTIIANQGKIHFNTTGNPALATAGSGDVLTGIITGLIAQNYSPFEASIFGVYLHGLTADIAMSEQTYETFIASNIIDNLSKAFVNLLSPPQKNKQA